MFHSTFLLGKYEHAVSGENRSSPNQCSNSLNDDDTDADGDDDTE